MCYPKNLHENGWIKITSPTLYNVTFDKFYETSEKANCILKQKYERPLKFYEVDVLLNCYFILPHSQLQCFNFFRILKRVLVKYEKNMGFWLFINSECTLKSI